MILLLVVILFFHLPAWAWINPDVLDSNYINLEEKVLKRTVKNKLSYASSALAEETVNFILQDQSNLINEDFKIPEYFKTSVAFWFSIYTQFNSSQIVIHDKDDLGIVYNILDFNDLQNSNLNRYAKAQLQNQLSIEYTKHLKKLLLQLSNKSRKLSSEEQAIISNISKNTKIPSQHSKRQLFFKKLAQNIRTQTGQRDMIYQGVLRSIPYFPFLENTILEFDLPRELLAITFLESSFNPNAYSKVGAAGAWQFMPHIANLFMPAINKNIDYRLNPLITSISAFHLLRENKFLLKRWDLAVTAYNSGTKHLQLARKKFNKISNIDLPYILEKYDHAHLGFASKNFYSEFLALVHVLAYQTVIYPLKGFQDNAKRFKSSEVKIYLAKCPIVPNSIFKILKNDSPNLAELNGHFRTHTTTMPAKSLLVSDTPLNKDKYIPISIETKKSLKPKQWIDLYKNEKCPK
jgi:membrane-bound lytic murein transglycosylase D